MDFQRFLLVMLIDIIIAKVQALPMDAVDRLLNKRRMATGREKDIARDTIAFKQFDVNADGRVTAHELRLTLQAFGMTNLVAKVQELMDDADADKNGSFDLTEYLAACAKQREEVATPREKFDTFDVDGDGFIERLELLGLLDVTGYPEKAADKMMESFDKDGDRKISYDEFVKHGEEKSDSDSDSGSDREATADKRDV